MRKLPLDLDGLIGQMHIDHAWGTTACLDLETGDLYMLPSDLLEIDPNDAAAAQAVSPWFHALLPIACAARTGDARFQLVPGIPRTEKLVDMAKFISSVQDAQLRESLRTALANKGPVESFYFALRVHAEESERWGNFYQSESEQRARAWLASIGIEPVPRPDDEELEEFDELQENDE